MIDSHCHIGFDSNNTDEILSRAKSVGITSLLTVACGLSDYDILLNLLNQYPCFYGAFGIHPENIHDIPKTDDFKRMVQSHPRLVAVGECGLDYHYEPNTKEAQKAAFRSQIELAHDLQKPIIIHTREADEDTISILDEASQAGLLSAGGVLHCFTGSLALAQKAIQCGLYISASGVITFKSAEALCSVFQTVPLNRLLLETDSPYLAPVPYRGKENEPSFMIKTAEKLAEIKGVTLSEIDQITTHNFKQLFKIQESQNES